MKVFEVIRAATFNFYVAGNMLFCATLFMGLSKTRETVSGFIGRKALMGSRIALFIAHVVDWITGDPGHCGETAIAEDMMRSELYPEQVVGTRAVELGDEEVPATFV
jgi:hypothetical protein